MIYYEEETVKLYAGDAIDILKAIDAGCPEGGVVLDPFIGSGTTAIVALKQGKKCIGIDLNPKYCEITKERIEEYLK